MSTVAELTARAIEVLQDPSLTGRVLALLNRGLREVAGRVKLPELDATDTVATATDAAMVALPSDFHHSLYWVGSAAQERRVARLVVYPSFTSFLRRYPDPALDESGDVAGAAVKGSLLYYQPVPAVSDTLTLHYYRLPALLTLGTDVPEGVPVHLHEPVLLNYVCRELFSQIEDGVEGRKVNTLYHDGLYLRALGDLERFVATHGEPIHIPDESESIYAW